MNIKFRVSCIEKTEKSGFRNTKQCVYRFYGMPSNNDDSDRELDSNKEFLEYISGIVDIHSHINDLFAIGKEYYLELYEVK